MGLSNYERETVILFNEAEKTADIYTHNPALKKQLAKLGATYPELVKQETENRYGGQMFVIPKKWIRVKPPRVLSPAQREVLDRINEKHRPKNMGKAE